MQWILSSDTARSRQLLSQPWFRDGLTKEEAALIVTLRSAAGDEEVFQDLLEDGNVRSETIILPLAGEVDMYAVGRSEPGLEAAIERMEFAVESMESFMGTAWPQPDVITLQELESGLDRSAAGWISDTHIVVKQASRNLTYHELAHFYLSGNNVPSWLSEGGADFLMIHTLRLTGDVSSIRAEYLYDMNSIAVGCAPHGAANVQGWIDTMPEGTYCPYLTGRQFLAGMHLALGREVVSSSLRELFERGRDTGGVATEDEIYQAFLTNTPTSQRDEFNLWYDCLHGRQIPGYTPAPRPAPPSGTRDALVALYRTTNGPGWRNSENWLTGASLDQWSGVFTDCDGSVIGLALFDNQLTGPIPSELGNLSNLWVMDLRGNQLTGEIPPELASLSNLEVMDLRGNQLTGEIPPELASLSNLEVMDLRGNQLTGEIPPELASLSNLELMDLRGNQLTGEIPPELASLSNLERLGLAENQLTGMIPVELVNLSNLRSLFLSGNQLMGEIPVELGNLSNLQTWHLWLNQLTGEIPVELGNLSNLRYLGLNENRLMGEIPVELGNLSNLERLGLAENQLTGMIPVELVNLSNLRSLFLSGNQLMGEIPVELVNLSNLRWVLLHNNQLTGEIPAWLGNLSNLEWLRLSNNQLTGEIPTELGNLSNLEWLDLGGNQLTGEIPAELGSLSNLQWLFLIGNQLTGEIPAWLGNLSNLEWLDLGGNQLTGEIPAELGSLSNLQWLFLSGNQLTGW